MYFELRTPLHALALARALSDQWTWTYASAQSDRQSQRQTRRQARTDKLAQWPKEMVMRRGRRLWHAVRVRRLGDSLAALAALAALASFGQHWHSVIESVGAEIRHLCKLQPKQFSCEVLWEVYKWISGLGQGVSHFVCCSCCRIAVVVVGGGGAAEAATGLAEAWRQRRRRCYRLWNPRQRDRLAQ